ncbi:MAG: LapA family protein [Bacteroidales bacterium]|jgi:uncharacterized integral membrane protein|nr:LapA family protein [Bacteroidales bacterium]
MNKTFLVLVISVLLVVLTLQNTQHVYMHLLFWEFQAPLVLALLTCLICGFLIAWVASAQKLWRLKTTNRKLQKKLDEIESHSPQPQPADIETVPAIDAPVAPAE